MRFENVNTPLDRDGIQKEAKPKPRHFFSTSPHEQETSSVFPDRGKGVLTPEEIAEQEELLEKRPLDEYGKPPDKLVIPPGSLPGGMKGWKGETSQGQDHNEKLQNLHERAWLYHKQGNCKRARELRQEILNYCKKKFGRSDPQTAAALIDLGDVYATERKFEQARKEYQLACSIYKDMPKSNNQQIEEARANRIDEIRAKMYLGQKLGNYLLVKLIGQGGFGSVYLGEHADPNEPPVAIKVLSTHRLVHPTQMEDFRQQFLNEAQTLEKLKHPHIVPILGHGAKDEVPFLVMPYAPNGTLREACPPNIPVPIKKALSFLKPLAQALQFLHDNRCIHLDVKPANVLLGPNGEIWLSDFGLVQALHRTISLPRTSERPPVAGSRPYIDPHYMTTGLASEENDQYSFTMVAFQLLTGESLPPSDRTIPGMAQEVQDALFKGLQSNPTDRFDSVMQCYEALEQACSPKGQPKMRTLGSLLRDGNQEVPEEAREQPEQQERMQHEIDGALLQTHYTSLELHRRADRYTFPSEIGPYKDHTFALMSHGMTQLRLGHPEMARERFNQVLQEDRSNVNAMARRGATYLFQRGQENKALQDFDQSIQMDHTNAFALASRGVMRLQQNQPDQAFSDFQSLVDQDASDGWAIGSRGLACQALGQHKEALQDYQRALEIDGSLDAIRAAYETLRRLTSGKREDASSSGSGSGSGSEHRLDQEEPMSTNGQQEREQQHESREKLINHYYDCGEQYRQDEQYDQALKYLTKVLVELDENHPGALASRARTYRKLGRHKEAVADYTKLINLEPNNAKAFVQRGITYIRLKKPDKALQDYETARTLDPSLENHAEFKTALDQLRQLMSSRREDASSSGSGSGRHLAQETPRGARERPEREQQYEHREQLIQAHYDSGYRYWQKREYNEAVKDFSQVLGQESNHARAREMRGRAYLALKHNGKALDDLKQVPPDSISISGLVSRGVAHRRLNNKEEAVQDFSRAIEQATQREDTLVEAYARRGEAHLAMNQLNEALEDFSQALKLDSKHLFSLTYCGQAYLKQGDSGKALTAFKQVLERDPQNATALLGRGRVYYQLKDYQKAFDDFDQLIRSFGDHALAYAERGQANQALGQLRDALADYEKALTLDRSLDWVKPYLDKVRRLLADRQAGGASSS
jgi:tetratricopeptide (TPR) repeat protein